MNPFEENKYPLECVDPIPDGFINLEQFFTTFMYDKKLTDGQMLWFMERVRQYVPRHILVLWQGFPEWEITGRSINELEIQLKITTDATVSPRLCAVEMRGIRVAEAYVK